MSTTNNSWNILLVDDDETTNFLNNLMISDLINESEIVVKDNALDALEYLDEIAKESPRKLLLFFDINMPAMDGFEFLNALGQREYSNLETTIVMLTSSINSRDIDRAREYQLYDIMEKPLTPEKLGIIFSDLDIK